MNAAGSHSRVLVAESAAPIRMGLRAALTEGGFEVGADAATADEAVETALAGSFDVGLIDVELPGDGIDAVRRIAARLPAMRLVLLTRRPSGEELLAAVLAGASGYLGKDISAARLPAAVRGVLAGEVALPRRYTHHLLDALRGRDVRRALVAARTNAALTDREWEVLQMLAGDASTAEMARGLGISEVTVRRHVSTLLAKLGVSDRASAAALLRPDAQG
ncbi:LuxR C-terminal-related transcriptional regulator [Candidatus Solirubrobacter pratensis]|uniref:LuxR C-terminal-related transcriptional regulator n=1 Tax=Candidatus Solirubrobacter pratensis TaxID=1298857 RepID=UPI00048960A3|nr:response regulator transcription factor [Candidatus Solirubrobacter pratensis]